MKVIEINNISKSYWIKKNKKKFFFFEKEKRNVVNNITMSFNQGEIAAILGKNGSGKSTLIKLLTGIILPDEGTITINGYPLTERKKILREIGVVFGQKTQLWANLPAYETFELHKYFYNIPKKDLKSKLEKYKNVFEMNDFWNQPVRELSLGQRMRCEIVASLLHSPGILFLDEPTIGFDILAKKKLRDILLTLNKEEGLTIFMTSHDTPDIEILANRTVFLDSGKLILDCPKEDLWKKINLLTKIIISLKREHLNDLHSFRAFNYKIIDTKSFECNVEDSAVENLLQDLFVVFKKEIDDIKIINPSIEEIIGEIYKKGNAYA